MKPNIVLLVDENEEQRRAFGRNLAELLRNTGLEVREMTPLPSPTDYAPLLAQGDIAALILDQKMEDGGVGYSGTQLSAHLRGIASKLPICILSNYTDDRALFEDGEADVEYIIPKRILIDPTTKDAQIFKARLLRRLDQFSDVLGDRAQRYHHLLVKSLREALTPEEQKDLGLLEIERLLPQQATELPDVNVLNATIAEIEARLKPPGTSQNDNENSIA